MSDLRDLLSRATPLPWVVNDAQPGAYTRIEYEADGYFNDGWVIAAELLGPDAAANAALIVAAVNALPNLLSELDGARESEERYAKALEKISAIRDSIVGMQGFNFSEHAYPLVAALDEAGFKGAGYEISRKNLGTLIEQIKAAEGRVAELEAALEPFAREADRWFEMGDDRPIYTDTALNVADLRRAARALGEKKS